MQKALKEDPTIFQYDEVYDEMERTKEEEKSSKKVERKAKYIDNLLKSADLRKKEQELRKDKMIQKEIEAEEAMYSGKERFVTSSYKAKLEEMKKFEEEQKNQDRLESIGDVTKQKDMSGFYRHLFRQKVERNEADLGVVSKPEAVGNIPSKPRPEINIDQDDPIVSDSDDESESKSDNEKPTKPLKVAGDKRKRQYRKKNQEESESEPEPEQEVDKLDTKSEELNKITEADRKTESPLKKQKIDDSSVIKIAEDKENKAEPIKNVEKTIDNESKADKDSTKDDTETKVEEVKAPKIEKVKINIWEKRTIGIKFEEALQRYMLRKQERYGS